MNAFYERLEKFGASVQQVSEQSGEPLDEMFTVVHPGFPVVCRTRSIKPDLQFAETCPVATRRKIRLLMRKAFGGRKPQSIALALVNYPTKAKSAPSAFRNKPKYISHNTL